jgi:hypothetical protein
MAYATSFENDTESSFFEFTALPLLAGASSPAIHQNVSTQGPPMK